MKRRAASLEPEASAPGPSPAAQPQRPGPLAARERRMRPSADDGAARTRAEAEARYVAARDAWTRAMHAAAGGRSADLASLAIAQETYEAAVAERERWDSGAPTAIPVEPPKQRAVEVAIGQELAWRRILHPDEPKGLLGRLRRRFGGH